MGGTSTDVAHFDGQFERAFETEVAGVRMRAPMMKIHTVAAGGGSILSFDGARFRVGPASAGADPGPAAYRRGGPLTVTDANLMTGKLIPDLFPKVFGPQSDEPLDDKIVAERFAALALEIGDGREPEAVADGFLAIAVAKMAEAIKTISVARGYDVTRYALNCFGGAGGQHACDVADALAISTVLIHPLSSLLSAYGMGLADITAQRAQGVDEPLRIDALVRIAAIADRLSDAAVAEVEGQGVAREAIKVHRRAQLRYSGSDTTIEVPLSTPAAMRRAFESAHKSRFGFIDRDKAIVIEAVSVEAVGGAARLVERIHPTPSTAPPIPARATRFFSHGRWREANVFLREALQVGAAVDGPALVIEPHQTIVVEQGWRAEITAKNHVVMTRRRAHGAARGDRNQSRSGHARDLQPSLHVDRRADGRDAAEHRLFGQHQGAARLFLRPVRSRGPPHRQCAAHAGASGLDGSLGRVDHPRQYWTHPPGRCVCAQRPL